MPMYISFNMFDAVIDWSRKKLFHIHDRLHMILFNFWCRNESFRQPRCLQCEALKVLNISNEKSLTFNSNIFTDELESCWREKISRKS